MSVDTSDGGFSRKEYKRAKKRRRREEEREVRHVIKLLSLAALGRTSKIEKLIRKHSSLDVNVISTEGFSALHRVHPTSLSQQVWQLRTPTCDMAHRIVPQ